MFMYMKIGLLKVIVIAAAAVQPYRPAFVVRVVGVVGVSHNYVNCVNQCGVNKPQALNKPNFSQL